MKSITIDKIVNGYVSSVGYLNPIDKFTVYHQDLDALFKHLTFIYNDKTQIEFTGEFKYGK